MVRHKRDAKPEPDDGHYPFATKPMTSHVGRMPQTADAPYDVVMDLRPWFSRWDDEALVQYIIPREPVFFRQYSVRRNGQKDPLARQDDTVAKLLSGLACSIKCINTPTAEMGQ